MEANSRLLQLKKNLLIEREEDYFQYRELFLKAGIDQRRKNGLTWYPVKINSEELGYADLLQIEVERTSHTDTAHQFSAGKNISLFSNQPDQETREINGTIRAAYKNKLKIILHTDELPDWCYDGKLGINVQFDDNSYTEMQKALDEVIAAKGNRVAELRDILEGKIPFTFEKQDETLLVPQLNRSQNEAIRKALSANDVAVIHGPPGTGKTTTLVSAIRVCLQSESQVLVCAPTNTAVDLLAERLGALGISVLRLGHPARISEDLIGTSLDGRIQGHKNYYEIKNLRKNAEEYFKMAGKYKRVFGKEDAKQRAAFYTEARNCLKEARQIEDFIVEDLFASAQVICCTPVTSTSKHLSRKTFGTLFFDEASQALEPMVWIPLVKCRRLILCGDHHQLPPVVKSMEAQKGGLGKTLLDRCIRFEGAVSLLSRQYRMNMPIMAFSNGFFYNNELEADGSVKDNTLTEEKDAGFYNTPVEFIDTAGCGFEEAQNPETLSSYNTGEGQVLYRHLQDVLQWYTSLDYTTPVSIGIISPYKEQIGWLRENQDAFSLPTEKVSELRIRTIDGFQGEECDIIYISLVRSNADMEIGFLSDIRRMNVAITRARRKLVVIGDSATIGQHPFYKAFIDYCETNGFYRSAWEFQ
ncbi:MAG: AAA domain-containing protein [Sediminibacterium sp.]|nr:AAA domain-containing protein [Sediminibacterium sp.]